MTCFIICVIDIIYFGNAFIPVISIVYCVVIRSCIFYLGYQFGCSVWAVRYILIFLIVHLFFRKFNLFTVCVAVNSVYTFFRLPSEFVFCIEIG